MDPRHRHPHTWSVTPQLRSVCVAWHLATVFAHSLETRVSRAADSVKKVRTSWWGNSSFLLKKVRIPLLDHLTVHAAHLVVSVCLCKSLSVGGFMFSLAGNLEHQGYSIKHPPFPRYDPLTVWSLTYICWTFLDSHFSCIVCQWDGHFCNITTQF